MKEPLFFAAAVARPLSTEWELVYIWSQARPEGKVIIICLFLFSIMAWSVMISKALQMRRARKLNQYFLSAFRSQKRLLELFVRRGGAEGGPVFVVSPARWGGLGARLRGGDGGRGRRDGVAGGAGQGKLAPENAVAQEALKLESGLILLAIAVSGAPFLGLLGTVWGVMSTFAGVAQQGTATLTAMAPGVAAALITTVAGLLVAIPSMFGYNWLLHHLRVLTVELDNFAQELASKMETEFLAED